MMMNTFSTTILNKKYICIQRAQAYLTKEKHLLLKASCGLIGAN